MNDFSNVDTSRRDRKRQASRRQQESQTKLIALVSDAAQTCKAEDFFTPSLVAAIVRACTLPSVMELLIEERASDILSKSRTLIKDATESKDLNCLCVGIYGLGALVGVITSPSNLEAVIKVLYHAIGTCDELLFKRRGHDVDKTQSKVVAGYCLLGFEILGKTLVKYESGMKANKRVRFKSLQDENVLHAFPVPVVMNGTCVEGMTVEHMAVIGIRSTLTAARAIGSLSTYDRSQEEPSSHEFHTVALYYSDNPVQALVELARTVVPPWIAFLASHRDQDGGKEVTSYCKQFHSHLWETASRLDATSSGVGDSALRLRQQATLSLLCDGATLPPSTRKVLVAKVFDSACSYAAKASSVYASRGTAQPCLALVAFHRHVGDALDQWATTGDRIPYMEYCAYRAMHTGTTMLNHKLCESNCCFRNMPFGYVHDSCRGSANAACLSLFFLILRARNHLRDDEGVDPETLAAQYRTIRDIFGTNVMESSLRADERLRFLKLLWMLSLHRTVFDTIESDLSCQSPKGDVIELAGSILGDCLGPLVYSTLNDVDEDKVDQTWDALAESFVRAISVFEFLSQGPVSLKERCSYLDRSNDIMERCVGLVRKKRGKLGPPSSCVDKIAKFLSFTGRRRHELDFDASVPLILSLQLFEGSVGKQSTDLSARWSFLASVFKKCERPNEAVLSLVAAISCHARERASENAAVDDAAFKAFRFMSTMSQGLLCPDLVVEPDETRASLVVRLAHLFTIGDSIVESTSEDRPKIAKYSLEMTVLALLNAARRNHDVAESFRDTCGVPFTMAWLLHMLIPERRGDDILLTSYRLETAKVYLEVLCKLGTTIQREDTVNETTETLLRDFNTIASHAQWRFRKLLQIEDSVVSVVLQGALLLLCGVFLFSSHKLYDFDRFSVDRFRPSGLKGDASRINRAAIKYVEKSYSMLSQDHQDRDRWSTMLLSVKALASLVRAQLSQIAKATTTPGVFSEVADAVQIAGEASLASSDSNDSVRRASISCLTSMLARLRDLYAYEGDKLQALQCGMWCRSLAGQLDDRSLQAWTEAAAVGLQDDNTIVWEIDFAGMEVAGETFNRARDELQAAVIHVQVRSTRVQDCQRLTSELWQYLRASSWSPGKERDVVQDWSRCTTMLALADLACRCGRLNQSLLLTKECFRCCQSACTLLASAGSSSWRSHTQSGWKSLVSSTLIVRFTQRQSECLKRMAFLYSKVGDRRKAEMYAQTAISSSGFDDWYGGGSFTFSRLVSSALVSPSRNCFEISLRRLLLLLKARATPLDLIRDVAERQSTNFPLLLAGEIPDLGGDQLDANAELEYLINGLEVASIVQGGYDGIDSRFHLFLRRQGLGRLLRDNPLQRWSGPIVAPVVAFSLKLSKVERFVLDIDSSMSEEDATACCFEVLDSLLAPTECQAAALYYLGTLGLRRARRDGSLRTLWNCSFIDDSDNDLNPCTTTEDSVTWFSRSLALLGPATDLTSRNCLRCLALAQGPTFKGVSSLSASLLLYTSVGSGCRQRLARALEGEKSPVDPELETADSDRKFSLADIFGALDVGFGDDSRRESAIAEMCRFLGAHLPFGWRVVAMVLTPSGELMMTSISKLEDRDELEFDAACVLPGENDDGSYGETAYDGILRPLDKIISACQDQLQGSFDSSTVEDTGDKRQWWKKRLGMDENLQLLIEKVEKDWLGSESARQVLNGNRRRLSSVQESPSLRNNLASRFDDAWYPSDRQNHSAHEDGGHSKEGTPDECTILILDDDLQRFPWESVPSLLGSTVCRLPCLSFLAAKLFELVNTNQEIPPTINADRSSYVVDPESNLSETSERLVPFLKSLGESYNTRWDSVVGSAPSKEFWQKSLSEEGGLLLYFGHGSAQSYCSRTDIAGFVGGQREGLAERRVRASIVLMGCSSGRLESVNRKFTKRPDQRLPMYYEPEGVALWYLEAGAPCVIGNLWDVTDRDIDRFSIAMLGRFLDGTLTSTSLAACVAFARSACRLKYIVGCAPVCYGIPVFRKP